MTESRRLRKQKEANIKGRRLALERKGFEHSSIPVIKQQTTYAVSFTKV